MLALLTIVIVIAVGWAYSGEGLFTGFCMLVNVLVAGLVAFGFFEPIASLLEGTVQGTIAAGYEDFVTLILLFCVTLTILRAITNSRNVLRIQYQSYVQQLGGALFGLMTGYLVAGFLVCALETMPWHENFFFFTPRSPQESSVRSFLPPDRVWLAMMRRAGSSVLAWHEEHPDAEDRADRYQTFDPDATFEQRYLRYRRTGDKRGQMPYVGEFDAEIGKGKR